MDMGGALVLNGRFSMGQHNNQPNNGVNGGGALERNVNERNAWGRTLSHRFGWRMERLRKIKIEMVVITSVSPFFVRLFTLLLVTFN